MRDFKEIIGFWPHYSVLANDIGVDPDKAKNWMQRNTIPCDYWQAVVQAAVKRKFPIKLETLAKVADERRRSKKGNGIATGARTPATRLS